MAGGECFAHALDDFGGTQVRVGWLGDLAGYLPMESGILDSCEQGLRRLQACGCAVEAMLPGFSPEAVWQAWLVWRRWLIAGRIAPYLAKPENPAPIKTEAPCASSRPRRWRATPRLTSASVSPFKPRAPRKNPPWPGSITMRLPARAESPTEPKSSTLRS